MCPAVSSSSVTSSDTFETQVCILFFYNIFPKTIMQVLHLYHDVS